MVSSIPVSSEITLRKSVLKDIFSDKNIKITFRGYTQREKN